MIKVKLASYTPNPEALAASAAMLCYSSSSIEEIASGLTDERVGSFVKKLSDMGHESPIEHVSFTFWIEGVSRAFLAQITRHRIASYSVRSQRYVDESGFSYVFPPQIEDVPEAKEEFEKAMERARESYEKISGILKERRKKILIESGVDADKAERLAEKRAAEDARFVLPNACETKLVCTFNARSLLNFFSLRCCDRAQWEINAVAKEMLRLASEAAPSLFQNAGPPCVRGACGEGAMSCGRAGEVRKEIEALKSKGRGALGPA